MLTTVVAMAAMLLIVGQARAQDLALRVDRGPEAAMADQLVLMTRRLLGGTPLRDDQLHRAAVLLDQAMRLQPEDADLHRHRLELARLAEDAAVVQSSLRTLARLEPDNDAVQWELIRLRLSQEQTLEARAAALRGLAEAGQRGGFTPALRSRIALAMATAAWEQGDDAAFAAALKQAIQLDEAHGGAAMRTVQLMHDRDADVLALGAAAAAWVKTVPSDVEARCLLADVLLRCGAAEAAAEQYQAALTLHDQGRLPPLFHAHWTMALAASGRTDEAMQLLEAIEASLARSVAEAQTDNAEDGTDPRLPLDLEQLRAAILERLGRTEAAAAALGRLQGQLAERVRATPDDPMLAIEKAGLSLLLSQTPPTELNEAVTAALKDQPTLRRRMLGWLALRQGDTAGAIEQLTPIADQDRFAAYGLARATADADAQVQQLQRLVQQHGGDLVATMAAIDLRQRKAPVPASAAGLRLVKLIEPWPGQVARPNLERSPWSLLRMRVDAVQFDYLEPIELRLELTNTTDQPLTLGTDSPMPTRLFLYFSPQIGGQSVGTLPPMVVDLGRRLRLEARETITVRVPAQRGPIGDLLTGRAFDTVRFAVSAVHDPRPSQPGRLRHGPLGSIDTVRRIERRGLPATEANLNLWSEQLKDGSVSDRMRAIARLTIACGALSAEDAASTALATRLADAMAARFTTMDPLLQAWTLLFAQPTELSRRRLEPLLREARRSDDPLVRMLYLASLVDREDDPFLLACLRGEDAAVRRFAEATREGIRAAAESTEP